MIAYSYNNDTMMFEGITEAFESPLEPGNYLLPAHATFVEPPCCGEGHRQKFNGESWEVVDCSLLSTDKVEEEVEQPKTQAEQLKFELDQAKAEIEKLKAAMELIIVSSLGGDL